MNNVDWGRRQRNQSEILKWNKSQEMIKAARASSRSNAEHFLAVLHQHHVRLYPAYQLVEHEIITDNKRHFRLLAETAWMVAPPRRPHVPGILVTGDGRFYWYERLVRHRRDMAGVKHAEFYLVRRFPGKPGVEVPPFEFADFSAQGVYTGLSAKYLEELIKILERPAS